MNRPALVVFGWAGLNALLTAVLVVYSYVDPFPLIVYACAVVLIGTYGSAVLLAARRRAGTAEQGWYRTAVRSTSAAFLAIGVTLIGLGFVYGLWLLPISLYPLVMAAVLARRERLPAVVLPDGQPPWPGPAGDTRARIVPTELPERPAALDTATVPHPSPGRPITRAAALVTGGIVLAGRVVAAIRRSRHHRSSR